MIKVNNLKVYNITPAILGIRNSYNSKSDSDENTIGEKDLKLIASLLKSGSSHRKFTRQIFISMDITAPLYWWKQMDQYKIGTTTNSESTMHTICSKPITLNDFSFDDKELALGKRFLPIQEHQDWVCDLHTILVLCEKYRQKYIKTKNFSYFRRLIQILPESYNQKRTWTGSLENLISMQERTGHKLYEWDDFLKALKQNKDLKIFLGCLKKDNNDYPKVDFKKTDSGSNINNNDSFINKIIYKLGE